jgi:hypothetical protein
MKSRVWRNNLLSRLNAINKQIKRMCIELKSLSKLLDQVRAWIMKKKTTHFDERSS